MIKVGLYPRVSSHEQTEGYSIDEQINKLNKYAEAMDWTVYRIYTDPGYSGANTNRPGLQEMLKDVRSGKLDKVVVYKLDRLSRSQKDTMLLIEDEFLSNGVDFVSITENFDTGTPFGRAMVGILAVFAQLERENIKERTMMGKEARAKSGKWHGSKYVPIGYDYDPVSDALTINEYEAMQIRDIYSRFLSGETLKSIERDFKDKGYRHRYGLWDPWAMRRVMSNKVNIGLIKHHNEYYPGEHEPLIDNDTFDKAVRLLTERREAWSSQGLYPGMQTSYLGGMIYCSRCGARFAKTSGSNRNGKYNYYYSCYSRSKKVAKMVKDPTCKNKNWKMNDLDKVVFDEIAKLSMDPEYINIIRSENQERIKQDDKIEILSAEIKKIDDQISRFLDLYGLGSFTIDQLNEKIENLSIRRDALNNELSAEKDKTDRIGTDDAVKLIESFEDVLASGDLGGIRLLIESLIEKIEIDGDDVYIYWKFA